MAVYYSDVEQRSEQWDRLRLGIPTSSDFKHIVTPTGKLSARADDYLDELLAAWMYGQPLEDPETEYRSGHMERGIYLEAQARQSYEFETDSLVEQCGFVTNDNGLVGASPDGLVGPQGLLELKCPTPKVHAHYLRTSKLEDTYRPQLQGLLFVCERQWVDIQSFCPPFPTKIIRVERDDKYIGVLSDALNEFVEKLLKARQEIYENYPQVRDRLEALATV